MATHGHLTRFSERYGQVRTLRASVREDPEPVRENVVQCVWYDQLFSEENLQTDGGRSLRVFSPGWWNSAEGPDFKGAQLEIGGQFVTGDVEVHLTHGAWKQHGHHVDERYDEVVLVVALESEPPANTPRTALGKRVPTLLLRKYLEADIRSIADRLHIEEYPYATDAAVGQCAALSEGQDTGRMDRLLRLAGEWRMLNKARALRERMERAGAEQAVYETFLAACGFSRYKYHFRAVAQQLPYERVRQLARHQSLLVETAFLQMAGLLPETLPKGTSAVPHFARLRSLRREHLTGLKSLPLVWSRAGVRPANYPERRLAGAARFLARSAASGLLEYLERTWDNDLKPVKSRQAFEALFPRPMGFWAEHCSWTGKKLSRPAAPLGPGRVRSIIGNVFVPAELALARQSKDRLREEKVFAFFVALPKESDNQVLKIMARRIFGDRKPPKLNFRTQQGLLQLYVDWCEHNPSCRNCSLMPHLDLGAEPAPGYQGKREGETTDGQKGTHY